MFILDINERIKELMAERNLNKYQLAKRTGLAQGTISNIFRRNTIPNFITLESICKGFGITMAQFFAEGDLVELTKEQQSFFKRWAGLAPEQKVLLDELINNFK